MMAQNKLTRFYFRIKNAVRLCIWAFKNPNTLQEHNFKMLSSLLELILKVAKEDRHLMTHIAYVHPEEGEKQIVSIWAGAGIAAEPTKRIAELVSEINILKHNLAEKVTTTIDMAQIKEQFARIYAELDLTDDQFKRNLVARTLLQELQKDVEALLNPVIAV